MAQSRFITIATSERSEIIYEQVKAKSRIKKVNAMLRALKKEGLYDESVAVENIFNYLDTAPIGVDQTKSGYISVRGLSGKSVTQLTGVNKAISEFIKNKTSTVSGMKELYNERRNEIERFTGSKEFADSLSYKDLRDIYKVFKSNEYATASSSFDSNTFFTLYLTAMSSKNITKDKFLKEATYYAEYGTDEDLKKSLSIIYDKFISTYQGDKPITFIGVDDIY